MVLQFLPVKDLTDSTTYLAYPMPKGRVMCKHYKPLLEKFENKFTGWKMHMLSHAGRLALIKHVLQVLPICYMGAQPLPKTTIKKDGGNNEKILAGKVATVAYLAYVVWDRICTDKHSGGLGLKRLQTLNEAMLLKAFWTLATNTQNIWVSICQAKYQKDQTFVDRKIIPNK